jgi:hypothetical protein
LGDFTETKAKKSPTSPGLVSPDMVGWFIPTCKLMLSTLIDMMKQLKSCSPLLRELSQDIHSNNISVILVEETGVPTENHQPVASEIICTKVITGTHNSEG